MTQPPLDLVILSNGPGELSTWVKPVVRALRQCLGNDIEHVRISVVLSPCVNANGQEHEIARTYPEVNRAQAAADFFPFLLWGKTNGNWDWRPHGVVIFLGGDQFFTLVIGKRLGYRTVSYIEWEARWVPWIDRIGIRQPQIAANLPAQLAQKCRLVGDLMTDLPPPQPERIAAIQTQLHLNAGAQTGTTTQSDTQLNPKIELIALLPGSRPGKLRMGVPLMLGAAAHIHRQRPHTRFVLLVAPQLSLTELAGYADPAQNSVLPAMGGTTAQLVTPAVGQPYLQTAHGLRVELWTATPTYELLQQCRFALTTFGANTAELATLALPMLIVVPTQEAWQDYDGLAGLLTRLPGVGQAWGFAVTWYRILAGLNWSERFTLLRQQDKDWRLVKQSLGLLAWPNLWAGREVVTELVGLLQPEDVAKAILTYLEHPETLEQLRAELMAVRGEPGAAAKLVQLVIETIAEI